jgi:hypothetical protein
MKWTIPEYAEILLEAYAQYQEAVGDDRDDVVQEVWKEIKQVAKNNRIDAPPGLTNVIFRSTYSNSVN